MLCVEIRCRIKDNIQYVNKIKLENYMPLIKSPLLLKVFEYMSLPLLINRFNFASRDIIYHLLKTYSSSFMESNCGIMIKKEIQHFIMFHLDIIKQ